MSNFNGLIDAVMEADNKFYAFVYRDNGNGRAYPVRCEVSQEQYSNYVSSLAVNYRDADSVSFDIQAQIDARADYDRQLWIDEQDNLDLERQDLW